MCCTPRQVGYINSRRTAYEGDACHVWSSDIDLRAGDAQKEMKSSSCMCRRRHIETVTTLFVWNAPPTLSPHAILSPPTAPGKRNGIYNSGGLARRDCASIGDSTASSSNLERKGSHSLLMSLEVRWLGEFISPIINDSERQQRSTFPQKSLSMTVPYFLLCIVILYRVPQLLLAADRPSVYAVSKKKSGCIQSFDVFSAPSAPQGLMPGP
ncbi:hypothetical protein L210DRAFT_2213721 [Boletus edulis BED1]|uniref:Uncharacterized protein n=1 Tax=Boletus edulis BED1 TaxID=1328754 RepID=A0AAD4BU20_BOLED|nr:hypothetical protein L210DRAFT_2213721 [Boletus edulis BED1]